MYRQLQPAITAFALGLIGLGVLALVYGDFALVWQPVPVSLPGKSVLAYASGLLMLFGGIGLLFRVSAAWSARILLPYLLVWLCLKVPALTLSCSQAGGPSSPRSKPTHPQFLPSSRAKGAYASRICFSASR